MAALPEDLRPPMPPFTVTPTEQEARLFALLLAVREARSPTTEVRVAGGWVRDKLLGMGSHDVDIALDDLPGVEFAAHVNAYLEEQGMEAHHIGVIQRNPEQSKHLETATVKVCDLWVDFVNLRAESYSESRIPEIRCGTAAEDAERRDFTVNALFYNLRTQEVEDFTGQGMADLRAGVLRTPLDPRTTLLDDPLRALRALRFATRFDLTLEESVERALSLPEVHEALGHKISRERVGNEMEGMLSGAFAHPWNAINALISTQLVNAVLVPAECIPADLCARFVGHDMPTDRFCALWYELFENTAVCDVAVRRLAYLALLLLPVAGQTTRAGAAGKKRAAPTCKVILWESFKLRTNDCNDVCTILDCALALPQALRAPHGAPQRVALGKVLTAAGPLWRTGAFIAACVDRGTAMEAVSAVQQHDLEGVWDLRPLNTGDDLMAHFGIPRGPGVRDVLERQRDWQLANPQGTAEECLAALA